MLTYIVPRKGCVPVKIRQSGTNALMNNSKVACSPTDVVYSKLSLESDWIELICSVHAVGKFNLPVIYPPSYEDASSRNFRMFLVVHVFFSFYLIISDLIYLDQFI